jgi:hypothetical protein
MSESSKWLAEAIEDGIGEWVDVRATEQGPPPDEHALAIYRLA